MDKTPGSITEPQAKFIADLVAKKDLNGSNTTWQPTFEQVQFLEAGDYSQMSKQQASEAIKKLLSLNDKPIEVAQPEIEQRLPAESTHDGVTGVNEPPDAPPVPVSAERDLVTNVTSNPRKELADRLTELEKEVDAGYYFVVNPALVRDGKNDANDGERFYHVSKPEPPSRWAGYTFIESRGGDFLYKVRDMQARIDILEEIKKDPITAMNEYGIRLGVCGCCGRTLTAKDSRLRGLGPICAAKILGAPTESQLALLDKLGLRKNA